ncbi:MAG: hypothetical protein MUC79_03900 [Thiobacillaceae bacterium]|jgi:hypothetical protein|nr:hypothetical protein [Thiobacillaceae bacterium]
MAQALRCLSAALLALLMAACGQAPQRPVTTETPSEPGTLRHRLEALAERPGPEPEAVPDAQELEARIQDLQSERQKLLQRYTENHPQVILLDRRIARLRERLSELPPPAPSAPGVARDPTGP